MNLINVNKREYREGDTAAIEFSISFFGIPIYHDKTTTENNKIVRNFIKIDNKHVKGF